MCLVIAIVQDWDLLLHDEEDIHFVPTRYDGIHYSLARRILIQSRGYRNKITRKRDKRANDNEWLVFKKLLHMGAKLLSYDFFIYREAKGMVHE